MEEEIVAVEAPETEQEQPAVEAQVAPAEDAPTPEAAPEPAVPADPTLELAERLAKLDPRQFRTLINRHPGLAGVIGAEQQRAIAADRQRLQEHAAEQAQARALQELEALAKNDPVAFTERWLGETEKAKLRSNLDGLRGQTRSEYATRVGQAYRNIPEWAELNTDDVQRLHAAVVGKNDDEAIPAFAAAAAEIVAMKKAQKALQNWRTKELAKERETIRLEEAAKLMQGTPAPSTERPKSTPGGNPAAMSDADFNKWWKNRYGR